TLLVGHSPFGAEPQFGAVRDRAPTPLLLASFLASNRTLSHWPVLGGPGTRVTLRGMTPRSRHANGVGPCGFCAGGFSGQNRVETRPDERPNANIIGRGRSWRPWNAEICPQLFCGPIAAQLPVIPMVSTRSLAARLLRREP